jgi:hypothetical protein
VLLAILLAVVIVLALATGLVFWIRRAKACGRKIGAPAGEHDAILLGDVMGKGLITSGALGRLEFFDWGVRVRGMPLSRWVVPTWEARYEELAIAELVTLPRSRIAVWLRLRGEASGMAFLTHWSEDALRLLGEHGVPVNRSVAQVQRVEDLYHLPR